MKDVKITYRGWGGHYILQARCLFSLNALLECGRRRYVVSTVGGLLPQKFFLNEETREPLEKIGYDHYYETMVFAACKDGLYWEANTSGAPRHVEKIKETDDLAAQAMHERVVEHVAAQLAAGEKIR